MKDKRLFLCQLKTLSPFEEDLYQGLIPVPADDEVDKWREVLIPFEKFHLTYRGYIEEPNIPFDGRSLKHIGFMIAERKDGPFKMEVEHVSACHVDSLPQKRYTGLDKHRFQDPES